jgi:hypothetical protein
LEVSLYFPQIFTNQANQSISPQAFTLKVKIFHRNQIIA